MKSASVEFPTEAPAEQLWTFCGHPAARVFPLPSTKKPAANPSVRAQRKYQKIKD
jgi:hypothetical protein